MGSPDSPAAGPAKPAEQAPPSPPAAVPPAPSAPPAPAAPDTAFKKWLSELEAPELQLRILGIFLGAIALAVLLLVFVKVTGRNEAPAPPPPEEGGTYTGLSPDIPTEEPTPVRSVKKKAAKKPAKGGRTFVERSEGARVAPPLTSPSASGGQDAPAPPHVRAAAPKEYVPGDAREYLSELKKPVPAVTVESPAPTQAPTAGPAAPPLPPLPAVTP